MAREVNTNLFAATGNDDLQTGKVEAMGLGLYTGELAAIDAIAKDLKITKNSLLRFAVGWFITQYRAGNIDLKKFIEVPKETKNKLNMPY